MEMRGDQKFVYERVERIPTEWKVKELLEIANINKEYQDPIKEYPEKKFFYLDIDSVENGSGKIRGAKSTIGKEAPSRARRIIHYNDVIMSMVRPYLKAFAIIPREFDNQICSTGFAVISCDEKKVLPHYLLYALFTKSVMEQCNKMMVGGQYPALNQSQVLKIRILCPPLPEQKKIAEVLGTADKAIEKVNEAIEKTQRLKKGLMRRLLTEGIGHTEFKETEIGRIPKEWDAVKLGDIALDLMGGGTPSTSNESYWDGNIPWMTSAHINGREVITGQRYITQEGLKNSATNLIPKGNLLIASRVGIGKVAVNKIDIAISQDLTGVVINKERAIPDFLYWNFANNERKLKTLAQGSTIKGILREDLSKLKLPLPNIPEQKKIMGVLGAVDERLELLRKRKERLEKIKRGLMEDLLTGRKRVRMS